MSALDLLTIWSNKGFEITIEVNGGQFDINDPEDRPYYVNMFYGDSNGPHKLGTLVGIGLGFTLEEALNNTINDLKHPYERK